MKSGMQLPWETYKNYINTIFGSDPDIEVGSINESRFDGLVRLDIVVNNHAKFEALKSILIRVISFGNIKLIINLIDTENAMDVEPSVKWKVYTDYIEIPETKPINITVSPEEVKDIATIFNTSTQFCT